MTSGGDQGPPGGRTESPAERPIEGPVQEPPEKPQSPSRTGSRSFWKRLPPWAWATVIVVLAGAAGLWLGTRHRLTEPVEAPPEERPAELPADAEPLPADLYFPGLDGRLYAERREFFEVDPSARALALARALLAGPSAETASSLRPPLPPGVRVEAVFLRGTTAMLDLRPPEREPAAQEGPPTPMDLRSRRLSFGTKQELVALYSLVDTLVLGVEGVERVQILWDGRQPPTFAGHVDTTRPLLPNLDLIAGD